MVKTFVLHSSIAIPDDEQKPSHLFQNRRINCPADFLTFCCKRLFSSRIPCGICCESSAEKKGSVFLYQITASNLFASFKGSKTQIKKIHIHSPFLVFQPAPGLQAKDNGLKNLCQENIMTIFFSFYFSLPLCYHEITLLWEAHS